jgi:hypothetical protein
MQEQTHQDKYIDYINKNILPNIDFKRLQTSYGGNKMYAREVLRALHDAVEKCYGTASFSYGSCPDSDGFVTLPGIAQGRKTGKIALVLVDIDLDSSGEHYGTDFLLDAGAVTQFPENNKALADRIRRDFIPYDYCYTPIVTNDIHVNFAELPEDLKELLETFKDSGREQKQESSWTQFEEAKRKAAEKKANPHPNTPNRNSKKEK